MTAACSTSGCGSTAAFLDTSTVRTAQWVQVRTGGQPADGARWFCSALCAALTNTAEFEVAVRTRLAHALDVESAVLAALDDPRMADSDVLLVRRQGLAMARRLVQPDQPDEAEPRCHLCRCTETDACPGGCAWVDGRRDTCTACDPPGPCTTSGCGTPADDVDGSDPALWGWICLYIGGTETAMRWVCSPWCATAAITAAGAELADTDLTQPATERDVRISPENTDDPMAAYDAEADAIWATGGGGR